MKGSPLRGSVTPDVRIVDQITQVINKHIGESTNTSIRK